MDAREALTYVRRVSKPRFVAILWNGNSWYSFDVWTVALPKAKTLFVTDGNATITLASGQSRLVGQDRYYVFTFDVTSYVVLMNLPADVVEILPWASVSIGPTGAMPQDFWQKIGAAASTVVNSLLVVGQMIYDLAFPPNPL